MFLANPQAGQSSFQQCKLLHHVDNLKADMKANLSVLHTSCIAQAAILFRWFDFPPSYWAAGSCDRTHSDFLTLNLEPKPFCYMAGLLTGLALISHHEEGKEKDQERPKSRTTREKNGPGEAKKSRNKGETRTRRGQRIAHQGRGKSTWNRNSRFGCTSLCSRSHQLLCWCRIRGARFIRI